MTYTVNDYRASTEAKKEADEKLIIDIMDEPETVSWMHSNIADRAKRVIEYMQVAHKRFSAVRNHQIYLNAETYENLKLELKKR